jgi:CTD small phosphatase-like protein 2
MINSIVSNSASLETQRSK